MSAYAFRVTAIREFMTARISRDVNLVSHELARIGRVQSRTELWLRDFPQEIAEAISNDCNPAVA